MLNQLWIVSLLHRFSSFIQWIKYELGAFLTSGTDWTGPKPDGPAIGSAESVGSDDIGLVIPLLVAIKPLDVDVHVDVVVAL